MTQHCSIGQEAYATFGIGVRVAMGMGMEMVGIGSPRQIHVTVHKESPNVHTNGAIMQTLNGSIKTIPKTAFSQWVHNDRTG